MEEVNVVEGPDQDLTLEKSLQPPEPKGERDIIAEASSLSHMFKHDA